MNKGHGSFTPAPVVLLITACTFTPAPVVLLITACTLSPAPVVLLITACTLSPVTIMLLYLPCIRAHHLHLSRSCPADPSDARPTNQQWNQGEEGNVSRPKTSPVGHRLLHPHPKESFVHLDLNNLLLGSSSRQTDSLSQDSSSQGQEPNPMSPATVHPRKENGTTCRLNGNGKICRGADHRGARMRGGPGGEVKRGARKGWGLGGRG